MMKRSKRLKSDRLVKLLIISVLGMILLTASSCGYSTANKPTVKVNTAPTGAAAGDVVIRADVANFNLTDEAGNINAPDQGHIIYYLDTNVPTYYDHSATSPAGTFAIASDTSHTWSGVTPGEHTFAVQLVKADDTPLPAPVTDSITINVGPPSGNPGLKAINPADGTTLPPGNIVVEVQVENFIISQKDMGVINRLGEGHLIYYFDEEPPVDAGSPALTETSVVSADTRYLWKNVSEGKHTLAVQMVNNNDTPLDKPVTQTISLDVQAGQ
jgi:hypothetical protein